MSRYCVQHGENHWISFGWDFPLNSFFAQLEDDRKDSGGDLLFDIGGPCDPYRNLEAFKQAFSERLHQFGVDDFALSEAQEIQLLADCDGVDLS